ncbi:SDH family Clp fold serine proteinase [Alloalcanivorax mobilis]|uniref:SDH family Clp fold serine proteinase n=1 Tax=Alloalcanivorax mobilis TaxID=2019569 RepID=UPI000C785ED6|nr:hypothetical protein [Alloalcanivorax mobilis]
MTSNTYQAILKETNQGPEVRKPLLEKLQQMREGRAVVSFFISHQGTTPLSQADADMIEEVLTNTDTSQGITLLLDAPGGDGLAAERIIQICKSYTGRDFETVVPSRAKSAATMVCLGSDRIIMSPTSELGPIDPQVPMDLGDGLGVRWVAAHHIIKSYESLMERAQQAGQIAPYLQQLSMYNPVLIDQLITVSKLAEDIAVNSIKNGMLQDKEGDEIRRLIEPFTNVELTMSHGRGIYASRAKHCGLNIEELSVDADEWGTIWALYQRSHWTVNSGVTKLLETVNASYTSI